MENMTKISMNNHDVRRLKSVCTVNEFVIVRVKNGSVLFIGDGGSYFKVLRLKCKSNWDGNFKVDSDLFTNITDEGFMGLCKMDENILITFNKVEQAFDSAVYSSITRSPITMLEDFMLRDFLNVLKGAEGNLLYIEALSDIGDVVKICTFNKIGVEITDGYIRSASPTIKMFKAIEDKELKLALDLEALKEIDKFGGSCKMHNVGNFLVLSRDDFFLSVRKSTLSGISYPSNVYNDDCASTCSAVDITKLSDLMKTYNKQLDKISDGYVSFDIEKSRLEVFNGRSTFVSMAFTKAVDTAAGIVARAIKIRLGGIHSLGILKNQDRVIIYSYGNILRLTFENGINLLMKGEVA